MMMMSWADLSEIGKHTVAKQWQAGTSQRQHPRARIVNIIVVIIIIIVVVFKLKLKR